jgi:hypothetical protein
MMTLDRRLRSLWFVAASALASAALVQGNQAPRTRSDFCDQIVHARTQCVCVCVCVTSLCAKMECVHSVCDVCHCAMAYPVGCSGS